jgi:tRNA threonylcarbamoyladenosine biosynthesis protein TsaB
MHYLLCLETATEICSVAISGQGILVSLEETTGDYLHSESLNLLIERAMEKAGISYSDLSGVVLSEGPGSYTALRVGTAAAKAICFALDIPLVPVPTLRGLFEGLIEHRENYRYMVPMIDARRMEVYTEVFHSQGAVQLPLHNAILDENSFQDYAKQKVLFAGNGCSKFKSIVSNPLWDFIPNRCSAKDLVSIGYLYFRENKIISSLNFSPLYLKKPNVTQSKRELF